MCTKHGLLPCHSDGDHHNTLCQLPDDLCHPD